VSLLSAEYDTVIGACYGLACGGALAEGVGMVPLVTLGIGGAFGVEYLQRRRNGQSAPGGER